MFITSGESNKLTAVQVLPAAIAAMQVKRHRGGLPVDCKMPGARILTEMFASQQPVNVWVPVFKRTFKLRGCP